MRAGGFFMDDSNANIIDEAIIGEGEIDDSSFFDSLSNHKAIIYPERLHFDLSVNVAKSTLSLLSNKKNRTEAVYDKKGRYLYDQIIAGMDEASADFYIKRMSSNLRANFSKTPFSYSGRKLAELAKKGLVNAHLKSKLTQTDIELALLSFTNNDYSISKSSITDRAEQLDISIDEAKIQLEELREQKALSNPARGILGRKQRRFIETIALHSDLLGKNGKGKCTYFARNDKIKRDLETEEWMKSHVISNGKDKYSLAEIGKSKKKTLSEMYCLAKGIQKAAESQGREWASIVCTLPPALHPNPTRGKNTWDGTTPNEASKLISKQFARVRSVLAKHGIHLSGFWTRESHLDATPHINFLVYFPAGTAKIVERGFRMHFDHGPKAVKFLRGKVDTLDDGKKPCSFASYAMKYFLKFFNENPSNDAIDEAAWASTWGLRRIAFIGLPSLQIWRGMRKTVKPINDPTLEQLRQVCRNNDSENWIKLCGGLNVKRNKRDFKTIRDVTSSAVVGIEHALSGKQHVYKQIGVWSIEKAKKLIHFQANISQLININLTVIGENDEVTVSLNYPRKSVLYVESDYSKVKNGEYIKEKLK